jgi:micrococcal nuclease
MYTYRAVVGRVVDGDTLDVNIDLGLRVWLHMQRLRLKGIDTPETFGVKRDSEEYKKGLKAKQFVEDWVQANGSEIYIKTDKDKTGKYGRWVCEIFHQLSDTKSLNQTLVDKGLAVTKEY